MCVTAQVTVEGDRVPLVVVQGSPIYPAKQVRFHFGAMGTQPQTDSPAEFQALYSSPVYPMQHTNDLQAFVLPSVMAVGGAMRVWVAACSQIGLQCLLLTCKTHFEWCFSVSY